MNFKKFRHKNQTEDLLLPNIEICETLIKQTNREADETLELELTKPSETFHFTPSILNEGDRMIGLTSLEVYNSIFNITDENNKFELYRDTLTKFQLKN